jgi:hypothetical protein
VRKVKYWKTGVGKVKILGDRCEEGKNAGRQM